MRGLFTAAGCLSAVLLCGCPPRLPGRVCDPDQDDCPAGSTCDEKLRLCVQAGDAFVGQDHGGGDAGHADTGHQDLAAPDNRPSDLGAVDAGHPDLAVSQDTRIGDAHESDATLADASAVADGMSSTDATVGMDVATGADVQAADAAAGRDAWTADQAAPLADAGPGDTWVPTCDVSDAPVFGALRWYAGPQRWTTASNRVATPADGGRAMTQVLLSSSGERMMGTLNGHCLDDNVAWGWFPVLERVRQVGGSWGVPIVHCLNANSHPFLLGPNRLFTHHGCGQHGLFRSRQSTASDFQVEHDLFFADGVDGGVSNASIFGPNDDRVAASHFTMNPEGRFLAFASNRRSAADAGTDAPQSGVCPGGHRALYLATANDPGQPSAGFIDVTAVESPIDGSLNYPMWLSDNGLRLIFTSNRDGDFDVFQIARPTLDEGFGAAEKIAALSTQYEEQTVTLPSLAAIVAQGCRGTAYVVVASSPVDYLLYEAPVCLGTAMCE